MRRILALAVPVGLAGAWLAGPDAPPAHADPGTRFEDFQGPDDHNSVTTSRTWSIDVRPGTSWLEVTLARPESLRPGGEVGIFNQDAVTWYNANPPFLEQDTSDWFTRLTWPPGALNGRTRIEITESTDTFSDVSRGGLRGAPARRPGDFYTWPSTTVDYHPGIAEAAAWAATESQSVDGLPPGEHGAVQRWMAYVTQVIPIAFVIYPFGRETAAGAWNARAGDPWGQANVFASGLRSLGFPTCVGTLSRPIGDATPWLDGIYNSLGKAPWVGVWSDDTGRFIPIDLRARHYGFLASNVQVGNYLEDFADDRFLVDCDDPGADFDLALSRHEYERPPDTRQRVRTRRLEDGGNATFICQDVLAPYGPGPVTGVPAGGAPAPERLLASHPFRHVLSLALRLDRPGRGTITVHDVTGRLVATPAADRRFAAGESFLRWLPGDAPAGVYFVNARLDDGRRFTARAVRSAP
jgi:hypothetical protein